MICKLFPLLLRKVTPLITKLPVPCHAIPSLANVLLLVGIAPALKIVPPFKLINGDASDAT